MNWVCIKGIYYNFNELTKLKFVENNCINIYWGTEREVLFHLTDEEVDNIKKVLHDSRGNN